MADYMKIHADITAKFYAAKRNSKITPELQAAYDKLHSENWLLHAQDKGITVSAADLSAVATTTEEKDTLKSVIGDWTK